MIVIIMTLFGNMQSAVTFITSCNPSTILGGKNGFYDMDEEIYAWGDQVPCSRSHK